MRESVRRLVESRGFQAGIIAVILVNAAVLGLEVSPEWMATHGGPTSAVGWLTVGIFVAELGLRLFAHGWRFFTNAWNVFDLLIVLIALAPGGDTYSVLRVLRVFRVLRLLSTVRSMRNVVSALVATVPGMASIAALLAMVMYIAAVASTQLFGETDPEHFGSLGTSMLSLFQVTTGDDWANVIRPVTDAHPAAWLFFIFFIVVATYIVLNLFIAVAVEALERETEVVVEDSTATILDAIDDLKAQVAALEARLPRG